MPGDGPISLAALIAATRATGYDRPWVVEVFSNDVVDPLYDGDLETVVARWRDGMARAWEGSGKDGLRSAAIDRFFLGQKGGH